MLPKFNRHCESAVGETKQSVYFDTKLLFIIFLFLLLSLTPFSNLYSQPTQPNPDSIPFAPAVNYGAGDGSFSVFCADLDRDGDLDLAVANTWSDNVSILKNNGDGTFQTKVDYGVGDYPFSVFCADLDGDGDFDLAVANEGSNNVSILKNLSTKVPGLCGDVNMDGVVDIGDIVYLINYVFYSGPDPDCRMK